MITFFYLLLFVVSVAFLVRTKSNGKYKIKLTDVIIGLIPSVLWLLLSGQILVLGDLKVKLREAYEKPVSEQVIYLVEDNDLIVVGVDYKYGQEDNIISVCKRTL